MPYPPSDQNNEQLFFPVFELTQSSHLQRFLDYGPIDIMAISDVQETGLGPTRQEILSFAISNTQFVHRSKLVSG